MERIDHFNLRSFDLNLMLAFDALFEERSVTRAAHRLRLKQPAMSHALATLRFLLDDELFVRVGLRMEPTPRALDLAEPIRAVLIATQSALFTKPDFDPATERRTFRIGLSDQLEAILLPQFVARLRTEAPGIIVRTRTTSTETIYAAIDDGTLDLGIGAFPPPPPWARRALLYAEQHVCCFHPGLIRGSLPLTLREFDEAAHVLVSRREAPLGYLEDAFRAADVLPQVGVTTTNFFNLLLLAAQAPLIATVPRRMAERFAPELGLTLSPPPFLIPDLGVEMVWHQRVDSDGGASWLRGALIEGLV